MTRAHAQTGSAIILALAVILMLVALGTAGIVFSRYERIQAGEFLTANNITHTINAGIQEGVSLTSLYSDPRHSLCRINGDDPNNPSCDATSEGTLTFGEHHITYQVDFRNYSYPDHPTFTVRAPIPDVKNETTVTLDANLNIHRRITTIH